MKRFNEVDILETEILEQYPEVLELLLYDFTTKSNIFWATDDYTHLGLGYEYGSPIKKELVTGLYGNVIMPRVKKNAELKQSRVRAKAEVFTPSWVCNKQNNLIDNAWFERDHVFNKEIKTSDGQNDWIISNEKIIFPEGKTWQDYIEDVRLEIACGEAPYIASRYDATTGKYIPVERRIGLLDRKLRVINENTVSEKDWLKATETAFKSIYAFDWQGDSLLLARESLLFTLLDYFHLKFGELPELTSLKIIAKIISWNVWQMDGLKGVIPESCIKKFVKTSENLFGEKETETKLCEGCLKGNLHKHNGIYCTIKDWKTKDTETNEYGFQLRFIDLVKKN
ncbi:restriction endonuclease subunit M [Chryseobacterium sp. A301]